MSVQLSGGFEVRDGWRRLADGASASLRDARLQQWRVLIRPLQARDADDHARAPARDLSDLGVWVWIDVADMAIELAFPQGANPTDGPGIGRLLVQMIQEAEDDSADEYGPPDDQEHGCN